MEFAVARKQEVIVHLVDDVDGVQAAETVAFALDGVAYEIDLSAKNAKALRTDLSKWTAHARKARKSAGTRRRGGSRPTGEAAAIRAWAHESGVDVPARGRIPAAVAEQYHAR
ncbi:MAG: histone-like nucleoid-structuring protein Lsr2 [Mycobacteriales bacterium]